MGSHSSFDIRKMAVLLVAIVSLASVVAFVSSDPEDGSVDASVPIEETDLGSFNDPVSDPYTFIFTKKEGSLAYIAAWSISGSGTITSSDDYSMTCTGEIGTVYVEYGAVVTTWDEFKEAVNQSMYSEIYVDTGGQLAEIPSDEPQFPISRSVTILGADNTYNTNGFIRQGSVIESGSNLTSSFGVVVKADVSISDVTFDGGAKWEKGSVTINGLDENGQTVSYDPFDYLGRGTKNTGVVGNASIPMIDVVSGSFTMGPGSVIQNCDIGAESSYSNTGGLRVQSGAGNCIINGARFFNNSSFAGAAVLCSKGLTISGNALFAGNGGPNCGLGPAVYVTKSGTLMIEDVTVENNLSECGSVFTDGALDMSGGVITNNTTFGTGGSNFNGGSLYAGTGCGNISISGGRIFDNHTLNNSKMSVSQTITKKDGTSMAIDDVEDYASTGGIVLRSGVVIIKGGSFYGNDNSDLHKRVEAIPSDLKITISGAAISCVDPWIGIMLAEKINNSDGKQLDVLTSLPASSHVTQLKLSDGIHTPEYIYTDSDGNLSFWTSSWLYWGKDPKVVVADKIKVSGVLSVTGSGYVGEYLISQMSVSANVKYQWYRGDLETPITGANGSSYVPVEADEGTTLYLVATGVDGYYGELVSNSIHITAKVENAWKLTYNLNGATGSIAPVSVTGDGKVLIDPETESVSYIGFTFVGWSTTSKRGEVIYSAGSYFESDRDVTLYAIWEPISVDVKFIHPSLENGVLKLSIQYGSMMGLYDIFGYNPVMTQDVGGKTFQGYYSGENGSGIKYFDSTGKALVPMDLISGTELYAAFGGGVTLNLNGGYFTVLPALLNTWVGTPDAVTGHYTEISCSDFTVVLPYESPERDGMIFVGYVNGSTYYATGCSISGTTIILKAVWVPSSQYHATITIGG